MHAGASVLLTDHFHKGDDYFTCRPEGMADWLITYTISGQGYFKADGVTKAARAGDLVLLRPNTPHEYGTAKGTTWNFLWAHFTSGAGEISWLPEQPLFLQSIDSMTARHRIDHAFRRMISDSRERGLYWQELCHHALREILLLAAQKYGVKRDPRIEETLRLLSNAMNKPYSIEELARKVNLSPSRLSHLFKEETGGSIIDTLNGMRLEQAALLLQHTDRTAFEVANDVGFRSYNHFSRLFRQRFGQSPSLFQKEKKQNLNKSNLYKKMNEH